MRPGSKKKKEQKRYEGKFFEGTFEKKIKP